MKFVIAPDSYKGSLTALQAADTMARAVRDELPEAVVRIIPMADGGEGTVDALVRAAESGTTKPVAVCGPRGERLQSRFGVIEGKDGPSAVLEAANLFGLPMVPQEERNPMHTTSRGLGDALMAALRLGCRDVIVGLGGSSTNDGGLGMLSALGAQFYNAAGELLEGYGRDLADMAQVDLEGLDPLVKECRITVACDVTNPLLGPQGASYTFGPQKGATPEQVASLDHAMSRYADLLERHLSLRLRDKPGAGAAGGLGFACMALGARIVPGAEVVDRASGLKRHIAEADWVLTGEGRSDGQTLFGKLPMYVAEAAREAGKQAILLSGSLGDGLEELRKHFAGCFSIVREPATLQACMEEAEANLYECTRSVARLLGAAAEFGQRRGSQSR
ncbi:glycerate kinase [Paenibacillus filicis]|uniref:Glycerate kinase n=1 Tax=Paenibacillus gyeongsangnamensis TaxID=3388067 RepID=A0ABT4Q2L4_9BACL|nr:glycerate kinase [Paenibacillus filicis]MCZ8511041.1 glycerate kinase [Paenibacillus filicis]